MYSVSFSFLMFYDQRAIEYYMRWRNCAVYFTYYFVWATIVTYGVLSGYWSDLFLLRLCRIILRNGSVTYEHCRIAAHSVTVWHVCVCVICWGRRRGAQCACVSAVGFASCFTVIAWPMYVSLMLCLAIFLNVLLTAIWAGPQLSKSWQKTDVKFQAYYFTFVIMEIHLTYLHSSAILTVQYIVACQRLGRTCVLLNSCIMLVGIIRVRKLSICPAANIS